MQTKYLVSPRFFALIVASALATACESGPVTAVAEPPAAETVTAAPPPVAPPPAAPPPTRKGPVTEDWNDGQIAWQPYDAGMAAAAKEGKPVCLILYTTWCPHCKNYSHVFHDPRVVERAKDFVMIRLDKDQNAAISKQYAPDGEYIPRTFFLAKTGELHPEIQAPRDKFKYFYHESDPTSVLAAMDQAKKTLN